MAAYTDIIVGLLQDRLKSLGLLRNTVFAFTSDNGTHHTLTSQLGVASILGDKGAPTDAGTHVPLVVIAPGLIKGGRVLDDLIAFADFLPTLAEVAGHELPATFEPDGVSFWPRLLGQPGQPRDWLYTCYLPGPFAEEFASPYTNPEVAYVRDKRHKLYRSGELFDLRADPGETSPVADSGAESKAARDKLQSALDSMPATAARIPPERGEASRTAARPRWR